jgi:hypothetical protein
LLFLLLAGFSGFDCLLSELIFFETEGQKLLSEYSLDFKVSLFLMFELEIALQAAVLWLWFFMSQ